MARALVQAAVERAHDPAPEGHALLPLARALDAAGVAAGLRAAAERVARQRVLPRAKAKTAGPHPADVTLALWRRLGRSAEATPEDGYALAAAEPSAPAGGDVGLAVLRQLLDRGFDVAAALRHDKHVDAETRYEIGFHLADQRHPAAEEILGDVAKAGRGKPRADGQGEAEVRRLRLSRTRGGRTRQRPPPVGYWGDARFQFDVGGDRFRDDWARPFYAACSPRGS